MTTTDAELYYDPYDFEIDTDPYPIWRRLRDEAPLYYNEQLRLLRAEPLRRRRARRSSTGTPTSSGKGSILELIKADIEMPPGIDPLRGPAAPRPAPRPAVPGVHAEEDERHRAEGPGVLRPQPRSARRHRRLRLHRRPRRPDADAHDRHAPRHPRAGPGGDPRPDRRGPAARRGRRCPTCATRTSIASGDDLRRVHRLAGRAPVRRPHDRAAQRRVRGRDRRRAARSPATRSSTYVSLLAGAGNETTTRLIGWTGKVLAEHPDQRREIVEDRSLVPSAIEEILRYEAPSPVQARVRDRATSSYHGQTVPEGSVMVLLNGSANRDDRQLPRRRPLRHPPQDRPPPVSFGYGIHFCLGAALARLEGRVALDEVLNRFPEWEVDWDNAEQARTSHGPRLGEAAGHHRLMRKDDRHADGRHDPGEHRRPHGRAARHVREPRPGEVEGPGAQGRPQRRTASTSGSSRARRPRRRSAWPPPSAGREEEWGFNPGSLLRAAARAASTCTSGCAT